MGPRAPIPSGEKVSSSGTFISPGRLLWQYEQMARLRLIRKKMSGPTNEVKGNSTTALATLTPREK
jgi:hypothetical protein